MTFQCVHIHVLRAHCPKSNWTSTSCKEKEGYTHLYVVLPHCLCSRIGLRGSGDEATGLYVDHRENDREIYCSHVWQELWAPMQGEIAGADVCLWVKLHSLHFFLLCCWIYNKQQKNTIHEKHIESPVCTMYLAVCMVLRLLTPGSSGSCGSSISGGGPLTPRSSPAAVFCFPLRWALGLI